MSSATVVPEVVEAPAAAPSTPVKLTDAAIGKVKEIMSTQDPLPAGLRIGVVPFEHLCGMMDKRS